MEIWDAYDREGNLTGEKLVRGQPIPQGRYHLVCEVLVRHADGSYLCMRRSSTKDGYPGWLEATAGGSALVGEDKLACVRRELREETGLDCEHFTQIGDFIFDEGRCFFFCFLCTVDCDKNAVRLQEGETEDFCWLTEAEFIDFVNSGNMIPTQRRRYDAWLREMGYVQKKKIYLVRHGADDETIRGGWSQHSLTAEGVAQAEHLAIRVERNFPVGRIYTSDLKRAMQTAEPIAKKLDLPIIPAPEFRETNNGELAGMKHEMAEKRYPGLYWNTLEWEQKYPGGESPKDFYERVADGWEKFQKQAAAFDGDVMLVTHGGVINVILSIVSGLPYTNKSHRWKIKNTKIVTLEYHNGQWENTDDK